MPVRQDFFEIRDLQPITGRSWIPLRQITSEKLEPNTTDILAAEIFVGIGTAAIFSSKFNDVDKIGWEGLGINPHRSGPESWGYHEADVFRTWEEDPLGINLVISQDVDELSNEIWHLHPDLVVALGLFREGDKWYRPAEGWIDVVRLQATNDGKPLLLEIRAEFLRDYLAARDMKLFCSSYSERIVISDSDPQYGWSKLGLNENIGRDRLEAITTPSRYPHPDGSFWTRGAIWRTEWIDGGKLSTRIRGDKESHNITFVRENDGSRVEASNLAAGISWLYFEPSLVSTLLRYRGSRLVWYSQETGALGASGSPIHFGVNSLGFITVLAKDIGDLPQWEQRLWSAHNVTPEGGVSRELFAAQMQVSPADTKAPEKTLPSALEDLNAEYERQYGKPLLRDHETVESILRRIHRFQAVEQDGLLDLSKELTRVFIERVDVPVVHAELSLKKGESPGSLKSIEKLIASMIPEEDAKSLMAPLFGIYDLRGASSHIGSSLIESGMKRARVDERQPAPMQGRALIQSFVDSIARITEILASQGVK